MDWIARRRKVKPPIQRRFNLTEIIEITGVDESSVIGFIKREWILPADTKEFDHEDLARIRLIEELRKSFGANDEAIPLILHLMDQLYYLRHRMEKFNDGNSTKGI